MGPKYVRKHLYFENNAVGYPFVSLGLSTNYVFFPAWTLGALIYEVEKVRCTRGVDKSRIIEILEGVVSQLVNE